MSIPPATPIAELVDRLLAAAHGLSVGDLAVRLGVNASYISQMRTGYRPKRMNAERRARLVRLVEELEGGYDERKAAAGGRSDFYDGVLFAAQAMSEAITRLLAEAREGLRAGSSGRSSPSAAEIADGLAALDLDEARRTPRGGKSSRRG